VDDLFGPPGVEWQRVSPQLAALRRGLLAAVAVLALAVLGLLGQMLALPLGVVGAAAGLLVAVVAWAWWLIGRSVARWGYAERDDELYVTRGALFRKLVVVPYGRMQFVDVQAGPLDQLAGVAHVQVHTASPVTSAVIPGLPADEAARLRDRLTVSGETRTAGL